MHNSKRKQQLTPETIKPGDVFYYFRDKCHFVGTLQDEAVTLYTYWHYNRYARRRYIKRSQNGVSQSHCNTLG